MTIETSLEPSVVRVVPDITITSDSLLLTWGENTVVLTGRSGESGAQAAQAIGLALLRKSLEALETSLERM